MTLGANDKNQNDDNDSAHHGEEDPHIIVRLLEKGRKISNPGSAPDGNDIEPGCS